MHLPHLPSFQQAPIVFLTACAADRHPLLANDTAHAILRDIWHRSAELNGWYVGRYVLMPDHVHLFARPAGDARPLPNWVRTWKSLSALRINRGLNRSGPAWQADYFDRYLRSRGDYDKKWQYVAANPVRMGLVVQADDWPYAGTLWDLQYLNPRG